MPPGGEANGRGGVGMGERIWRGGRENLLVIRAFNSKNAFRPEKVHSLLTQQCAEPLVHTIHVKVAFQLNANRND